MPKRQTPPPKRPVVSRLFVNPELVQQDAAGFFTLDCPSCEHAIQFQVDLPADAEPKPAPAAQDSAAEYRASMSAYDARERAAADRAKVITNLLGNLSGHDLQALETVRLMESRTPCG